MSARLPRPTPLPWRRPRHELLTLGAVAVAALAVVTPAGWEDITRLCLTRALVHGNLSATSCLSLIGDRSSYGGQYYTNVAPGLSALAVPAAEALRLHVPADGTRDLRLWALRALTSGVALLVCAFLLGRIVEGLAPRFGRVAAVTFALGTIAGATATTSFGHLSAAAFAFGAFVLAWGRRPLLAGLAAGLAVVVEYQTGLIAVAVGLYVLLSGRRAALEYAAGTIPGLALLGAYDWAAFGSPFHLSYRYDELQSQAGLFGIGVPSLHGIRLLFLGDRGLLLVSPVLAAAAIGLVLLWRSGRPAEAAVCAAVTLAFLIVDAGYADPYGGESPGPRFVIPALPFLAVGLAPMLARWTRPVAVLALASVVASTAILLSWPGASDAPGHYRGSVWRELVSFAGHGSPTQFTGWFQKTLLGWAGVGTIGGFVVVLAAALGAFALSFWRTSIPEAAAPVEGRALV